MENESGLRKELASITQEIYHKGYTPPLNGNMSVRLDEKHILITPTYVCKGLVTEDRLLKVNFDLEVIGSNVKPSIETGMHIAIYKQRPEINAVIHAHPKYISTFAVARKPIDISIMPESIYLIGALKCIEYIMPGSSELRDAVSACSSDYDAFLLYNHGMITIGRDIFEAYYRLETLELCAELDLKANAIGGVKGLPQHEIDKLLEIRKSLLK